MKKRILVGILIVALSLCLIPMTVQAASTDTITITATGAEVDISVDTTAWDVGNVVTSQTYQTGITSSWATITNNAAASVDVTIGGRSMKDSTDTDTWTLSDTATAGADTFGMKCGLDDGDDLYDIIIKNQGSSPNLIVDDLAGSGTEDFGLQFLAPTSMSTYEVMEMVGTVGNHDDTDRGLLFTGSVGS